MIGGACAAHGLAGIGMQNLLPVAVFAAGAALVIFLVVWSAGRQKKRIRDWTKRLNFQIVSIERAYFNNGPFGLGLFQPRGSDIFRVIVWDKAKNKERIAWIRFTRGILSAQMDGRWEKF